MHENGSIVVLVDAMFGHCRKKSAGKSVHRPLSGTAVFDAQEEMNPIVSSQNNLRTIKS